MQQPDPKLTEPQPVSPGSRGRRVLFWIISAAFIAGGIVAGAMAIPNAFGVVGSASLNLAQQLLPVGNPANPLAQEPDWKNLERVNILLMGVDRRPDEGTGAMTRTDTMMVLTYDPFSKTAGLLSIPRDTYVPIPIRPGFVLQDRINTATVYGEVYKYPGGGLELARDAVQYNLGVHIHYYVMVDFDAFRKLIDTLGGVDVDVPVALVDNFYPTDNYDIKRISIPAGSQHLDGERALQYARSRHQDSDFGRIQRQQQVMRAARAKLIQLDVLPKLPQLWLDFKDSVQTDMPLGAIVKLAAAGRDLGEDGIIGRSLDAAGGYVTPVTTADGASILVPNRAKMREVMAEVFFDVRKEQEGARIELLNGTGTPGLAAKTARQLEAYGFDHIAIGDAGSYDHQVTEILNLTGKGYTANLVATALKLPRARVREASGEAATLPTVVDLRIILGDDMALQP
ncbi:MAG: LytR family transcriptional regulator [Dehalococcoidia bacterium]|nr:LytR family transcriptional regulator [Dehalococcoidia bacterium]